MNNEHAKRVHAACVLKHAAKEEASRIINILKDAVKPPNADGLTLTWEQLSLLIQGSFIAGINYEMDYNRE